MNLPPLAILAGGLATRMRPITEKIPKSLISVNGEPFLAHQLRLARRQGFNRAVLCTGHLGEQIEHYIEENEAFGLEITFSRDGSEPRGTGGALRNAIPQLGDEFIVVYGDSYLEIPVLPVFAAYQTCGAPALMTVLHNCDRFDPSNVVFDGERVREHRKGRRGELEWIDYGMSVMKADVLSNWPDEKPFDLSEVTASLARSGDLAGYAVQTRFFEVGKPEGLRDLEEYLAST